MLTAFLTILHDNADSLPHNIEPCLWTGYHVTQCTNMMLVGRQIVGNYTGREACCGVCCHLFIIYVQSVTVCTSILKDIACNPVRSRLASLNPTRI